LGMQVTMSAPAQNMVIGYLPISNIMSLPDLDNFSAATPAYAPLLRTGSALAQSDAVIGGPGFRAAPGATGHGGQVGVLSGSVSKFGSGLAGSVASGDLPPNVQVLQDGAAGNADEGRAMLEIVHDIAPGASLAFHTANGGPQAFANGIIALANAGA